VIGGAVDKEIVDLAVIMADNIVTGFIICIYIFYVLIRYGAKLKSNIFIY
jgi:hypothetical protein